MYDGRADMWTVVCITGCISARQLAELTGCCSESVATCTWPKPKHMCASEHVCHSAFSCLQGRLLIFVLKTVFICIRYMKHDFFSFYSFQICCLMRKLNSVLISACVSSSTAAPVWAVSVLRPQLHCIFLWDRTLRLAMYVLYALIICII
jgi:hypothetical protein